jgi:hypothetical protein
MAPGIHDHGIIRKNQNIVKKGSGHAHVLHAVIGDDSVSHPHTETEQ